MVWLTVVLNRWLLGVYDPFSPVVSFSVCPYLLYDV